MRLRRGRHILYYNAGFARPRLTADYCVKRPVGLLIFAGGHCTQIIWFGGYYEESFGCFGTILSCIGNYFC